MVPVGRERDCYLQPAGRQVFIDDKMVSSSSDSSQRITISHVLRGERTLRVKRDGFEDAVSTLKLGLGDFSKTVEVRLTPYIFSMTITSVPTGCKVLLDGKEAGSTDSEGQLTLKEIARGSHTVTVQRTGYQDWTQNVSLTSSQTIRAELYWPSAARGKALTLFRNQRRLPGSLSTSRRRAHPLQGEQTSETTTTPNRTPALKVQSAAERSVCEAL